MPGVGLLIFFAVVGSMICARARVAGGAVVFALIALVLFVNTPSGSGLPSAIGSFLSSIQQAAAPLTDGPHHGSSG